MTESDSLTSEKIRTVVSNRRNQVLTAHAAHILPYRGMGTGVPRALNAWPKIDLVDEPEINQFRAVVWRTVASIEAATPQVTPHVTPQVLAMLVAMTAEHARQELMALLDLSDRKHFAEAYLAPALKAELLEMTIPDKPQSSKQKYRLTAAGKQYAAEGDSP